MKRFIMYLTVALAVLVSPVVTEAQLATGTVRLQNAVFTTQPGGSYGNATGGAFNFTWNGSNVNAPNAAVTFSDFVAYCIDPNRSFNYNTNYTYQAFALSDLAGIQASYGGNALVNLSQNDLNEIADLVANYSNVNVTQGQIWDLFTNVTDAGQTDALDGFVVLVGQANSPAPQTFLTRTRPDPLIVPEPSTFALLGAGLFGLGIVARKRKIVTA